MDSAGVLGIACDQELATDCVGGFAVHAGACFGTRRVEAESLCVDGRCHISRSLHRTVHVVADFVHAGDHDDLAGALCQSRDAVRIAVDVDQNAVLCDRVGAHQEYVCIVCKKHGRALILHLISVDEVVIALFQCFDKADLMDAHTAAHSHRAPFGNQTERLLHRFLLGLGVITRHVAGCKALDHLFGEKIISLGDIFVHIRPPCYIICIEFLIIYVKNISH